MKNLKLFSMLGLAVFVLSGCQAVQNKEGFFYSIFVKPMEFLLEFFGNDIFAGSYGLAIIAITVLIRLVLMPIMLKNYRQQQLMKTKMDAFKPEMEAVQKKMKEAKTKEEQTQYQQEMMALYQKHGINPLNMGCLPMLIQMPIIMGLYFSILYSTDVKSHEFLWFSLGSPDIVMTIVAGIVYLVQARVSLWTVPEQQKAQMKMFIYISPIMIVFISMSSMAALPLYWSVSGALLILQTYIGRKYYSQHPEKAK
ncbi:membrane protein insertase YidC [Lysinibacillus sp. FSL R7-0073]|uniref:Membrane protein insertase YidC n=1 Tax=Lysinibacillus fusiformis TaxID=28031 RepID=A0A1E4R0Y8_9BACI|nr:MULTISPECIES: membrane protein insertase YidC [Lysinibacillus]MBD8523129.1 membrane protein insertase YidC [Lysinibacillus fusiformis]MCR8853906.1 membrane protein insertase YidC [Lysinibacillus fusiformis]MED4889418.1 membrane protein insertase YidC [Lysinibacillus fusiformis]ODV54126.1 OxaA precursor [Lysinibacillus fusiformis]WKT76132.1 membrane protein insertase YidC [Lysinibacillus fusiformis]